MHLPGTPIGRSGPVSTPTSPSRTGPASCGSRRMTTRHWSKCLKRSGRSRANTTRHRRPASGSVSRSQLWLCKVSPPPFSGHLGRLMYSRESSTIIQHIFRFDFFICHCAPQSPSKYKTIYSNKSKKKGSFTISSCKCVRKHGKKNFNRPKKHFNNREEKLTTGKSQTHH